MSDLFDKQAKGYDRANAVYCEKVWNAVLPMLPEVQGRWVLDAGCGTGLCTQRLADDVGSWGQVVGVDISSKMLELAKVRLADQRNITLFQSSMFQVESHDRSFDVIVCLNVLRHIDDLGPVLREWRRLTKTDGEILVVDVDGGSLPVKSGFNVWKLFDASLKRVRSCEEVSAALQNHGFSIISSNKAAISLFFPVWIIRAKKN